MWDLQKKFIEKKAMYFLRIPQVNEALEMIHRGQLVKNSVLCVR